MLYATTRNSTDSYTAQRVLTMGRGPDGGLFVPFRIPQLSAQEVLELGKKNFNANLADGLNLLFGSHLTSYDMDLALGRSSVRLQMLGQKILMGECWHNTDWHFDRMVRDLSSMVLTGKDAQPDIRGWARTGVRIAVLFGIFGELIREGIASLDKKVDISVVSGDFDRPMAAWYARAMGLPVGNIICCCNENAYLWDFICHGQLRTDGVAAQTLVPEADVVVPEGLEQLIAAYGGPEEAEHFAHILHRGGNYYVEDTFLRRLRQGIYVTVSSEKRILSTISSAYGTHRYLMTPAAALCYAGLQDYRARTEQMPPALILTEYSQRSCGEILSEALGISQETLQNLLK